MGTSKFCLSLLVIVQLVYVVWSQEVVKRVPHGFIGMRGKKYLDSGEAERFYKRKPQFFVGVKGKKSIDSYDIDSVYYKRAPLGFVGMRGKKDFNDLPQNPEVYNYYPRSVGSLIGQIDYATNDDIKNEFLQKEIDRYLNLLEAQTTNPDSDDTSQINEINSDEQMTNDVDKRAANIHQFFGVRGKKSIQNKRPYDMTFRGKFIGVRGKKDGNNGAAQEIKFLLDQGMPWPKRKAQMGFFGMRGKKWTDESTANTETPI